MAKNIIKKMLLTSFKASNFNMVSYMSIKSLFLILFFISFSLHAEVEIMLTGASAHRTPDDFDGGMKNFSYSYFNTNSISKADSFRSLGQAEFAVRFTDVAGPEHRLGFAGGSYFVPFMKVREFRTDLVYFQSTWKIFYSYYMFTYHYLVPVARRTYWETGMGFGIIPEATWNIDGTAYSIPGVQRVLNGERLPTHQYYQTYQSRQKSDYGSIVRIETGLLYLFKNGLISRIMLRGSMSSMATFNGTVNGADSRWYFMSNGKMTALTYNQLGDSSVPLARVSKEVMLTTPSIEIAISGGFRF